MESKEKVLWERFLSQIEQKIAPQVFKDWFRPLKLHSFNYHQITIETPDNFFKNYLKENYLELIEEELKKMGEKNVKVRFITFEERKNLSEQRFLTRNLNPRYNFDNFVVGNNNRLAHAAALAVAQSLSQSYNPLFIYGDVGLGKTHLLQAIAHYIIEHKKGVTFTYLSSERFTNELINAIRDDKTIEFRRKYRNIDALLVDDIHFLAGKERTQEEFFHTFNALYEAHKQIVLSSDRPPTEIPTLEKRLQSRFEWGLIADIQPPDLETRIAILKKKAKLEGVDLPNDVAIFIAERIKTNIRKLEGCLVRLFAYSSLHKREIDRNLAKQALMEILPKTETDLVTIELIQKIVSRYYKVKKNDFKVKKRQKSIAFPRQVAMYLCRELTNASFPEIGEKFGGKDHTTVMYACKKIEEEKRKNDDLKRDLREIERLIRSY
ncbi:chromosomal replication initiator protein DnaA [Candidatus Aerophobetes bacterium]|nr:chromosomal replication initiator protein DnaA [Candidatus Aerophobetes bacterium]